MSTLEANTLFSTKGLVAVVTGGGTGIGLMIAAALEHNGAERVYIVGRRKEVLENAAKEHSKYGKIIPLVGEVTSKESLESVVAQIKSEVGYINLLVNNAGTVGNRSHAQHPLPEPYVSKPESENYQSVEDLQAYLWKDSVENWDNVFRVNATGAWFTSVAFLALLDEGNKRKTVEQTSQIVTIVSIAGFSRLLASSYIYAASKAAMIHIGKMMATNLAPFNIRSNMIAPGLYPSEMTVGPGKMDTRNKNTLPDYPSHHIPMLRPGKEEDMAGAILYLVSKAGAYCSGTVIVSDGARLSVLPATY
ncbi:hypothetical protein DFP73DRAFT_534012 [Morchella snyderi]|nr:hypothetical protein DFP73DRAFT_534012 [Morchella snyderi]